MGASSTNATSRSKHKIVWVLSTLSYNTTCCPVIKIIKKGCFSSYNIKQQPDNYAVQFALEPRAFTIAESKNAKWFTWQRLVQILSFRIVSTTRSYLLLSIYVLVSHNVKVTEKHRSNSSHNSQLPRAEINRVGQEWNWQLHHVKPKTNRLIRLIPCLPL